MRTEAGPDPGALGNLRRDRRWVKLFQHAFQPTELADTSSRASPCSPPPREVGLEPDEVRDGIERAEIKEQLKGNTEEALAHGVTGIPTVAIGDELSGATTASTKPRDGCSVDLAAF